MGMEKAKSAARACTRLNAEDANAYFSLLRTVFWVFLCGIAYAFGWLESVTFVSLLSIWALVETSWAAFRADRNKRTEQKLDEILERLKPPIP